MLPSSLAHASSTSCTSSSASSSARTLPSLSSTKRTVISNPLPPRQHRSPRGSDTEPCELRESRCTGMRQCSRMTPELVCRFFLPPVAIVERERRVNDFDSLDALADRLLLFGDHYRKVASLRLDLHRAPTSTTYSPESTRTSHNPSSRRDRTNGRAHYGGEPTMPRYVPETVTGFPSKNSLAIVPDRPISSEPPRRHVARRSVTTPREPPAPSDASLCVFASKTKMPIPFARRQLNRTTRPACTLVRATSSCQRD